MVEFIQELLLTNNCVIIPGFGAFIGNYQPSEIRLSENKIFPPSKNIAFNRTLQANDGLLTTYIAHNFSISYKEAEEKVDLFAKTCNESLRQHKSLIFKNIGRLTIDSEDKIQFQPYFLKNYLIDSFGLKTLKLTPIQRLKDAGFEMQENYQRVLHPDLLVDAVHPTRTTKKSIYWITAFLAIAFITSSVIGWNLHKNNQNVNYSSLLPVFDSSKKQGILFQKEVTVQSFSKFIENKIAITNKEIAEKNFIPTDTISSENLVISNTLTYIVIGTFFDQTRAEKLKKESENIKFSTSISDDNNDGLFRVMIAVENIEVTSTLEQIKSKLNPRAWVYCVSCNPQ